MAYVDNRGAREFHFFSPTSGIYSLDRCGTDFLRVAAPWGHDIEVCIGFPRYTGSRTRFPHYNLTLLRPCVSPAWYVRSGQYESFTARLIESDLGL